MDGCKLQRYRYLHTTKNHLIVRKFILYILLSNYMTNVSLICHANRDLSLSGLTGVISPSIQNLTMLRELYVST